MCSFFHDVSIVCASRMLLLTACSRLACRQRDSLVGGLRGYLICNPLMSRCTVVRVCTNLCNTCYGPLAANCSSEEYSGLELHGNSPRIRPPPSPCRLLTKLSGRALEPCPVGLYWPAAIFTQANGECKPVSIDSSAMAYCNTAAIELSHLPHCL